MLAEATVTPPTPPMGPPRVGRCQGHGGSAEFHPLQCSQAQRRWRVLVQRTAAAGAAQRYGCAGGGQVTCVPGAAGQQAGPGGPERCPVSSLSPYLLLQGTSILPPEHAASLCRCYEEKQSPLQEHLRACSLRGECGGVGSGFHSRRCMLPERCLTSGRRLDPGHMWRSYRAQDS